MYVIYLNEYIKSLNCAFAEAEFPDDYTLEINIPIFAEYGINNAMNRTFYYAKNIKSIKFRGNYDEKLIGATYTFQNCEMEIADFSDFKTTFATVGGFFINCSKLHTVLGEFDLTQSASNVNFAIGCTSLKNITFKANSIFRAINFASSSLLTDESVQSIINGLADLTSDTAQTLNLHATVKNKLTDGQITQITSKNWTLA